MMLLIWKIFRDLWWFYGIIGDKFIYRWFEYQGLILIVNIYLLFDGKWLLGKF